MRWTVLRGSAGLLSTDIENAILISTEKPLTGAVKTTSSRRKSFSNG